jgi:nucleoside 2-deoxyribosyltransferase
MGLLDGAVCYLSGPMEFVSDHGVEWRRKFIRLVNERGLEIDCIDPTNKPGGEDIKIGENKEYQVKLQEEGKWQELRKYVHSYRRYDLRFVDISDFLIAVVDPNVPQWGTANEIYVAEMQHKPMFFIIDGGLAKLPRWLFDVIELDDSGPMNVYETVEEVIDHLCCLDRGHIEMSDEWVLIRRHLEALRHQLV